jgi:hypothetical protein
MDLRKSEFQPFWKLIQTIIFVKVESDINTENVIESYIEY